MVNFEQTYPLPGTDLWIEINNGDEFTFGYLNNGLPIGDFKINAVQLKECINTLKGLDLSIDGSYSMGLNEKPFYITKSTNTAGQPVYGSGVYLNNEWRGFRNSDLETLKIIPLFLDKVLNTALKIKSKTKQGNQEMVNGLKDFLTDIKDKIRNG